MLRVLILLIICTNLFSKDFTMASYNVENLFDLKKQNTEYKEYIPYTKSKWNKKSFQIKVQNLIKVIKHIDADIIALQEVENEDLLKLIKRKLPLYKYHCFSKYKNSSIGLGFLSKIKILDSKAINVKFKRKIYRPILESTFLYENNEFKVFNNHWPSKRVSESYRIKYALELQKRVLELPFNYDYILLGDFNSNYDEMQSFKYNKKLNNTDGITGINQVLNTSINKKFITSKDILKYKRKVHYNLWLEVDENQRFSSKFRNQNNTPDNIVLSQGLFDNKNISYVKNSFKVFKPSYLYKNRKINRWQIKNKVHLAKGFSDHLPILARFTNDTRKKTKIKNKEKYFFKISDLYEKTKLLKPLYFKDVLVIYKNKNSAILKQKNNRSIYAYKNAKNLKLGFSYDIKINQIKNYNGLKEIESFEILKQNKQITNINKLYLNAQEKNILDFNNQNEIITNLKGIVKNRKLHFNGKTINLYSKNKSILPKHNEKILIKTGHLSLYRGNMQILIHKKSDYKVEKF